MLPLAMFEAAFAKNGTALRAPMVVRWRASTTASATSRACARPVPATASTPVRRLARTTVWPRTSSTFATFAPTFRLAPSNEIFMGLG
ncbi:hypothetical protein C1C97_008415 [Kocuria tytonis]|uniref:Uncharacterized protein n=1 Tax=Kocuria tytonis TaxID=2054280 RepID=A0A495A620_9MICC|nr:hypothetical protein C1C97_008415 [Kocuria tytonis]